MQLEFLSDDIHGADKSSGKIGFTKVLGQLRGDGLPEFLTDLRMDPAVSEHHEFLPAWHDENQDAIVFFRAGDAEPNKGFLCCLLHAPPEYRRDGNHDFTRSPALGPADCDVVFYDEGIIDLGSAIADTLALSLNPYPRSAGADAALKEAGILTEAEAGPFAALAQLKKGSGEG